jgi:ABC-type lipoprotein export system ATPase subunit
MLIECSNVTKKYIQDGQPLNAVDNANLKINEGDFVIILGHSGSGKTTLLSLIGGLTSPDNGTIHINGTENWQQNDQQLSAMRNSTIGFIFQFASLVPTLTALENILLPLSFGGVVKSDRKKAEELLELVGLKEKRNSFPAQLSGGQQRRVAIARAFINDPAIILADEPTGDLDEETEQEILSIFRRYNEKGTTFIVVTHNNELAKSQNNPRIMKMKNGILSEQI